MSDAEGGPPGSSRVMPELSTPVVKSPPLKRRESWMLGLSEPQATSTSSNLPAAATAVLPQFDEPSEDGPVFRATLGDLEKGVLAFRKKVKHLLRSVTSYVDANKAADDLSFDLLDSMKELTILLPATTYLEQALTNLRDIRAEYLNQIETLVLQPLKGMYENELLLVDEKKKVFDKESSEYYGYQEKYLAMDKEKMKKKNAEKDKKFQQKRAKFNLLRFDYLTFMEEINTKKQQELLYHASSFAEKQHRYHHKCAKSLDSLKPQLDELTYYSTRSWADISTWIKDRQTIRKNIEDSNHAAVEAVVEKQQQPENVSKYKGIRDLDITIDTSQRSSAEVREGFLFTQSSKGNWKQVWCVLADGWFQESSTWKVDASMKSPKRFDLRFCAAKEAPKSERRFCFEIISPQSKRLYQASSEADVKDWLVVIQRAVETSLELPTPVSTHHNRSAGPDKEWLRAELTRNTSNLVCADCGAAEPEWCSINLGIMICIECSGIHRSLGTHISKVRSINLDTVSWTPELIEVQKALGNKIANSVWELTMPPERKPLPTAPRTEKLSFIKDKYANRAFVSPFEEANAPTPFHLLMDSIVSDDVLRVYYAIALGADVNGLSDEPLYEGKGPLHLAIEKGDLVCAEIILQNRGEVDLQSASLNTSLHYASKAGDSIAVTYLLGKGANKELRNKEGLTAAELEGMNGSPPTSPTFESAPNLPPSSQFGGPNFPPSLNTQVTSVAANSDRRSSSPVRTRAISLFSARSPFSSIY